ncbi:unnamed protein product [Calypogeia fissa]
MLSVDLFLDHATRSSTMQLIAVVMTVESYDVLVPVCFVARPYTGKASADTLAAVSAFSGVVIWPGELLEGNLYEADTLVYVELEEVFSFISLVPSSLDAPL